MDRCVLFDVNKTLVRDSKDVSEYMTESIRTIYGVITEANVEQYEGMAVRDIAAAILKQNGVEPQIIEEKMDHLIDDVPYSYYNVAGHDDLIKSEGAQELLDEIKRKGALIGIASGEPERMVRQRLENRSINEYFKFGAFGNEAKTLPEIVSLAVKKAANEFRITNSRIAIVSSSPHMIKAARSMGIFTIGVANGSFSEAQLKEAGASLVVKSLKDRGRIVDAVFKGLR
ncbi:MAG: HAD family hydrolase [Candidatus Micrarchaeota archaeon]|nr:HAD family hydrolase [Candidatus Micrarchaeota archaeon]